MESFDDILNSQNYGREDGDFDKDAWVERKRQEREGVFKRIDDYASEMGSDEGKFKSYLDVQARFDRHSAANAILISDQMPSATKLADFDTWKRNGAYVRKGASTISILEPGREYERKDGSIGMSYNIKKVFDVSQTNERRSAAAPSRDIRLLVKSLVNSAPCRIVTGTELTGERRAVYDPKQNIIMVRPGMDGPDIFRSVSLAVAQAQISRKRNQFASPGFSAYCAAYMLCKRNGVAVEGFSFSRLPDAWTQMDGQDFRLELEKTREVSGAMIRDIEKSFEARDKGGRSRDDGAR